MSAELKNLLIGLVILAGIFLLSSSYSDKSSSASNVSLPNQQFNAALVDAKQKCQSASEQWAKDNTRSNSAGFDQVLATHFSSSLNTCLIEYMFQGTVSKTQTSKVIDIYQGNHILLELDIDTNPSTNGIFLAENGNLVKLYPWQDALNEYDKRKAVLFEQ